MLQIFLKATIRMFLNYRTFRRKIRWLNILSILICCCFNVSLKRKTLKSLSLLKLVGSIFESGIVGTSQILNISSYDSWWQIITICRKIRLFEKWLFGIHIVVTSLEIWRLLVILVIDKIYGWNSCLCPLNYIIDWISFSQKYVYL